MEAVESVTAMNAVIITRIPVLMTPEKKATGTVPDSIIMASDGAQAAR
jgi:vacuolar-type H+-ATPase subunit B/Vma2